MLGVMLGMIGLSLLLNSIGSSTNPMFAMPWYWHLVVGGFRLRHGLHGHRSGVCVDDQYRQVDLRHA
jgi:hypothetical protein